MAKKMSLRVNVSTTPDTYCSLSQLGVTPFVGYLPSPIERALVE